MVINNEGLVVAIEDKDIDKSGVLFFPEEAKEIHANKLTNRISKKAKSKIQSIDFNKIIFINGSLAEIIGAAEVATVKYINAPNLEIISLHLFDSCYELKKASLDTAKRIEAESFWSCHNLQTINCPNITFIGDNAFARCFKLSSFEFPKTLKSIGKYSFLMSGIKSVTIPEGAVLGASFVDCKQLEVVRIHDLSSIRSTPLTEPFKGCEKLEQVIVDELNTDDCFLLTRAMHGYTLQCKLENETKRIFCFSDENILDDDVVEVTQIIGDAENDKYTICLLLDGTYRVCTKDEISSPLKSIEEIQEWVDAFLN